MTFYEAVEKDSGGNPLRQYEYLLKAFCLKNQKEIKKLFPKSGKVLQETAREKAFARISRASLGFSPAEKDDARQAILSLFNMEAARDEMELVHGNIPKMPAMAQDGTSSAEESA